MEENSLSYTTLKNATYNFVGYIFPIVFAVFVTPIVVRRLGVSQYGIFVLTNTIVVFLNMVELGLSTSLIKFVSEYAGKNDTKGMGELLGTARSVYVIIGLIGFIIFAILGKWFLFAFKIGGGQEHIFVVFLLAGILFFFNSLNSIYAVVPVALQRFDIANKISMLQSTLISMSMLILVLAGFQLKAVMAANVVVLIISTTLLWRAAGRLLPNVSFSFIWNWGELRRAYRFGIVTALSGFALNALGYLDRLLIPIFIGPNQLTYYSLPGNVGQKVGGVTNSLSGMFLPLASNLSGKGDMETIRKVYVRGFRNLTIIAVAMAVPIVLFANKILLYWLGSDFAARGTTVLILVTLTYVPLSLYLPLHSFLLGLGKIRFLLYGSLVMAALNLVLLVILVPRFGIMGAAWAYLISVLPVIYLFYSAEKKFLGLTDTIRTLYTPLYGKLLVTILVFTPLIQFGVLRFISSLTAVIITGPLAVVLFLAIYYGFGFMEGEDELLLKSFIVKFFKQKRL